MGHHYYVRPRYTPGSPATVSREIAEQVAKDEKHFIEHALEGAWGEAKKVRAEKCGLRGIVERRVERRDHWEVEDLCTGESFVRYFPDKLTKLGWRQYDELAPWERTLVDRNPPEDIPDPSIAWYKLDHTFVSGFPSDPKVLVYREERVSHAV